MTGKHFKATNIGTRVFNRSAEDWNMEELCYAMEYSYQENFIDEDAAVMDMDRDEFLKLVASIGCGAVAEIVDEICDFRKEN